MRNQFFDHLVIPQRVRNTMSAGFLLTLCALLQGCATSTHSRASYTGSESQAFMTMEWNRGAQPQESPFIRLVSFKF